MSITMQPIGKVFSGFTDPKELREACSKGRHFAAESEIAVDGKEEMLRGLSGFSHAWVLFHLHKANRVEPVTHPGPPGMKSLPKVGVLASRSQYRPNHIALRLVELISVEGKRVRVRGLDAIDGSPVLDIKPYVQHFDRPDNPKEAEWYRGWGHE
jgi:tRNA-Thr(GGU) m(6)t(6)A37 methyltransferase TsaA